MPSLLLRHLLESTLFCILLMPFASCLLRGATSRYAAWLIAIAKFAIPSVLLTAAGAKIAFLWPASSWLLSVAARISALLFALLGLLPSGIPQGVFAVWVLGAATMLGIWLTRLRSVESLSEVPTEERAALARVRRLLQVKGPVQLRRSQTITEPALLGVWRPVIRIPKGLYQKLAPTEFEAVLLHELAHARRMDNLTGAFAHSLVCIFWFHPLLWLAEKRLRTERERACDELVLACGITPQIYISGILKVCQLHWSDPLAGVSGMAGSDVKRRLQLICAWPPCRPAVYIPRLLTALAAVLMLMLPIAGGYCEQCVSHDGGAISQKVQRR